jgi:hypothetical protein
VFVVVVVVVDFVIDSVQKILDTPSYIHLGVYGKMVFIMNLREIG